MAKAQFDREEVIEKALQLFWQHGFSAATMQQVVKATGLKPGSIYLAFENKEGLFREAIERYAEISKERIRRILDSAPSIGVGICQLFEENIMQSEQEGYSSCFLVKTRLELSAEGNELHKLASEKLDEIEVLYANYLEKEVDSVQAHQRAISIMLHIFGMRVYGYQPNSADRIRRGLRQGLFWLPWDSIS